MSRVNTGKGTPVQKWRAGEPIDHRKLNQVVDQLNAMIKGATPIQQVFPSAGDSPPMTMERLQIVSIGNDYLVCCAFDGVTPVTDSLFFVSKPPELRRSRESWNGLTYVYEDSQTRTATNADEEEEEQVIVPAYVEGDTIFAVTNIVSGTGVLDQDGVDYGYLDMNVAGRAWAKNDA